MPSGPAAPSRPRIGLALGSGGARGWSHIGVIDALEDAGIEADIVCGSSMGALVGAAYTAGRLAQLRAWAEAVSWRDIAGLIDVRLSGGGLIDGAQIVGFLRSLGITGPIENHPKKFAAIATDLVTGWEMWLQTGPICDAVRASIALPGIIRPAKFGDKWLLDGGLVNPVPVSVCRALGADVIIAVNLNGGLLRRFAGKANARSAEKPKHVPKDFIRQLVHQMPESLKTQITQIAPKLLEQEPRVPGYFQVLATSINIMQDHITRARLAGEPPHLALAPRLDHIGLLEFNRAKEAIAEGRSCVKQVLPVLRELL